MSLRIVREDLTNMALTNTIVEREPGDTLAFVLPIMDDITNLHCIQLSHVYTYHYGGNNFGIQQVGAAF